MSDAPVPASPPPGDPFTRAEASASALLRHTGEENFDTVIVLGSGWLTAADAIGTAEAEVPLAELGYFEQPSVKGHAPSVRYIRKGHQRTLVYLGRIHLYEGYDPHAVAHGVRTAVAAGCRTVILTNAAGGINPAYAVGQPVLITDHINLTGRSPLWGPLPPRIPSRFTDLTEVYSGRLRALARELDPSLAEGVYASLPGPHFETPAEIRMLRGAGADLVGMSTVMEAIAARHLGAEVLGISMVSNPAAGLSDQPVDHQRVLAATAASAAKVGALLSELLPRM
ncbi:MAG TPA: purine-nucleoside phosphorylase [Trebonia sp.]|nr:purine-nucleoside phosphorylase [Trebonia sp.]